MSRKPKFPLFWGWENLKSYPEEGLKLFATHFIGLAYLIQASKTERLCYLKYGEWADEKSWLVTVVI